MLVQWNTKEGSDILSYTRTVEYWAAVWKKETTAGYEEPLVKTSPFNAGVGAHSPVRELRPYMPYDQKTKHETFNNVLTNSLETLTMVHIKKKKQVTKTGYSKGR